MSEQINPELPVAIRRERDFGAIIGAVFEFVRANARMLFKSVLFIVGPVALLAGVGQGMYMQGTMSLFGAAMAGASMFGSLGSMAPGAIIMLLFGVVATAILFALTPNFVLLYMQRGVGGFDVGDVWEAVKEDFGRVFGTIVVLVIFMVVPMLLVLLLVGLTDSFGLTMLVTLLAIPASIYVGMTLSLTLPIRVVERLGIGESIRRSFTLISGKWWFTFWLFFVLGIIVGILSFIVQMPLQIVLQSAMLGGADPSSYSGAIILASAVGGALTQLIYVLFAIASTLQYFNLVEMKEGVGMLDRIQEIGSGAADAGTTQV